jgi:hypothetical protein
MGDIMYVDLPCHQTRSEHGRLFIRILTADKQMHKLCVPIRGRVVEINYQLNFNAALINKDPFGKGWIVRLQPFNLEEDLKNWSGNISFFSNHGQAGFSFPNKASISDSKPTVKNEPRIKEKPEAKRQSDTKKDRRNKKCT